MTHKAKTQINNFQTTFQWSLGPILIWMNLIGVPFDIAQKESVIRFGCATCYSLLLFFFYLMATIYGVVEFIMQDSSSSLTLENSSATLKWNSNINYLNEIICKHGTHLVLMTYSLFKWKELASVLHRIEKSNLFHKKTFNKFRKVSFYGLICALFVSWLLNINA